MKKTRNTKTPKASHVVALVVVLLLLVLYSVSRIHEVSGSCSRLGRVLTNEELLNIAVRTRIESDAYLDEHRTPRGNRFIGYQTIEAFRLANPHCCTVVRGVFLGDDGEGEPMPRSTTVMDLLFSRYLVSVVVVYRRSIEANTEDYIARYLMDACGDVIDFTGAKLQ